MEPVAIVGYAQSDMSGHMVSSRDEMIFTCVKQALDSAGIVRDDLDTVISCGNDFYDGHTISQVYTLEASGAYAKDESKVEQDGLHALVYAVMRLLAGQHKIAMVVAYSRASDMEPHAAVAASLDPVYDRQFKVLNDTGVAAFQARAYMERYGLAEDDLALVVEKNTGNGARNPKAKARPATSKAEVLASAPAFTPLRELMVYPNTDGICVAILAAGDRAESLCKKPVWVKGLGWNQELYYLGDRDLTRIASAEAAAAQAFKAAGIGPKDIGLIELSELFAHQEPMLLEAFGFAKPGEGRKLLRDGVTAAGGKLPVNVSGGALSACALSAVGLVRAVECARQLRGEAELPVRADFALAHGQCGLAAQNNVVAILGREK